jgi:molybdopterin converting factor small subunit
VEVELELHGFLGQRLAELGRPRGARTILTAQASPGESVADLLQRLVRLDARFGLLFDPAAGRLPEHVEVVLNQRVLDLQGGLAAPLSPGDRLGFLPAHAGGSPR